MKKIKKIFAIQVFCQTTWSKAYHQFNILPNFHFLLMLKVNFATVSNSPLQNIGIDRDAAFLVALRKCFASCKNRHSFSLF